MLQRFIHDFQAESGSAPGPFAVEAFDAGNAVLELAREPPGGRKGVADALGSLDAVDGLLGTYLLQPDGALGSSPAPTGSWRASGSRWLPFGTARFAAGPGVASALPIGAVLPIVRPRKRPHRARGVHRSGGEP
jgi:hypothetical protein